MRKNQPYTVGLVALLSFAMVSNAYAFDRLERVGGISSITGAQNEFKNSNRQNRLLIEVNMVSGVQQKGIHQVPDTTNLVEMVSLAGGPESNARLSEVYVKRKTKGGYATLEFDLEKLVTSPRIEYPQMQDGDVVMIERSSMETWYTVLSILGVTAGIVVSGLVIRNELRKD